MKDGRVSPLLQSLVILLFLFIILSLGNCNDPGYKINFDNAGNRIITVKKGIGHFSMELSYPYEIGKVRKTSEYTDVYFYGPISEDKLTSVILVQINDKIPLYPDIETYVRESLSLARSRHDFKLIDESIVEIADIYGYYYSYSHVVFYPSTMNKPPVTMYTQSIYFKQSGLYWNITTHSGKSESELANEALKQVMKTFKVLD